MATSPQANGAVIRLKNVSKTYRMGDQDVNAMRDISIDFNEGTFTAVMGPSGSGKSTMLNLLGCLDRPTSGEYHLAGEDVSRLNDDKLSDIRLRYLGFVFQSFNLIPQLTVLENIELPLFYLGWEPEESAAHARKMAELVGLAQRLSHRPKELSGGQQQRVAIARALANDPRIILADEPTGNLDSQTGIQIMNMLCDLNKQGKTIVMVTHEPDIASYAGRQIHMLDGRIDRIEEAGR
jgi:putative ABC transport system ATP-binding protein